LSQRQLDCKKKAPLHKTQRKDFRFVERGGLKSTAEGGGREWEWFPKVDKTVADFGWRVARLKGDRKKREVSFVFMRKLGTTRLPKGRGTAKKMVVTHEENVKLRTVTEKKIVGVPRIRFLGEKTFVPEETLRLWVREGRYGAAEAP